MSYLRSIKNLLRKRQRQYNVNTMSVGPTKVEITISNKTIIRVIVWVLGASLLLVFFNKISHALTLVFAAFFMALALNPAVSKIMQYLPGKSRVRATGVAYLLVLSILLSFILIVIPPIARQTATFIKDVPTLVDEFQYQDSAVSRAVRRYKIDEQLTKAADDFSSNF